MAGLRAGRGVGGGSRGASAAPHGSWCPQTRLGLNSLSCPLLKKQRLFPSFLPSFFFSFFSPRSPRRGGSRMALPRCQLLRRNQRAANMHPARPHWAQGHRDSPVLQVPGLCSSAQFGWKRVWGNGRGLVGGGGKLKPIVGCWESWRGAPSAKGAFCAFGEASCLVFLLHFPTSAKKGGDGSGYAEIAAGEAGVQVTGLVGYAESIRKASLK